MTMSPMHRLHHDRGVCSIPPDISADVRSSEARHLHSGAPVLRGCGHGAGALIPVYERLSSALPPVQGFARKSVVMRGVTPYAAFSMRAGDCRLSVASAGSNPALASAGIRWSERSGVTNMPACLN